jgi:hypothetical protein
MVISARPGTPVRTHTAGIDEASFGELAARLSEQVSRLVRDELALAQVEAKQKAKRLGLGIGMFGASGLLALFGAGCAVAAAVLGLAIVVDAWLAAVLVAVALFIVAGGCALAGKTGVKRGTPPIPREAVESAKADVAAVRQAVKR